ncbi:probable disease resistance RPP8-like protein 2 [Humulus lupulus]|uniref:probable disease resistance RPP8-like protein 2 n=1 Tax=Humulus lupulus TaxID=3486 RepID=UPI002B4177DE|nr:probable disease resistance RPP8-like protein 2 [Humulus lupulus]
MEVLGREMVGHCSGLPLAIIMLSGLLSEKQTVKEWEDMKGNVMKYIAESNRKDDDSLKNGLWVLGLSYDELPFYIKPCFLYLAHYPEDATIRVKEVCRMLVAEGFIAPSEMNSTKAIEDVAYDCLNEFVKRSMIQVENWGSTGRIKTFRIHDLMREFCLSKGRDDLFIQFVDLRNKAEEALKSVSDIIRRVAVYTTYDDFHSINFFHKANKSLRCLVVDMRKERIIEPMLERVSSFLMLRVLNLSLYMGPNDRELPKEIGQLIHLRWFKIRCGFFMTIPSSIGNLRRLQTFKLDAEVVSIWRVEWKIPKVLWKWEQLRHLCLPNPYGLASSKWSRSSKWLRLPNPRNLQTLEGVQTKYLAMDDFLMLINLKKLKIYVDKDLGRIYHDPENNNFTCLESLQVVSNERFIIEIVPIILSYPRIYKLKIMHVRLVKLPEVSQFSPNLMKLALKETFLEDDPMPTLEKLPNLRVLYFYYGSFTGDKMVCSKGGFPRLESLHFESLHSGNVGLKEWKVEKGALSSLRFLVIDYCRRLSGVSDGLKYITTLKEMKIQTMPREFKKRLEKGGDDFYKVQHVPSRIFFNCNYAAW